MSTKAAGVSAEDMIVIVDDISGGTRAYRVDYFTVDVHLAVLRPVFGGGKTIRDFPGSSYRLTYPGMDREWLFRSAERLLSDPLPNGQTTDIE